MVLGQSSLFSGLLNPILGPLLSYNPLIIITVISVGIAIITTLAYKFATDQNLMKELKDKIKSHQKEMKQHKGNPEKMMKIQKQAMEANMQYMMHNMKPMLFTFLPIIIIFGWASAHLVFAPIVPGIPFTAGVVFEDGANLAFSDVNVITPEGIIKQNATEINNDTLQYNFQGDKGEYFITYELDGKSYDQHIIISDEQRYASPIKKIDDGKIKQLFINQDKLKVINIFGWRLGWLGTYIIITMIASISLKKIFKIH